ncbi:MAG: hypothetical protein GXY34_07030 [Syntrophomonadaceae bacterium]|nr:hypothetical protein [Syntrophomonadaceae bacterium]
MSKIGRNEPCPCGSGKKYKKCCMDKAVVEAAKKSFAKFLSNLWTHRKANEMTTEEIISKLQSMGIAFDKSVFLQEVEEYYSAVQLSEHWYKTFKVTAVDRDEEFPWVAVWVLWERLAPHNNLSMEQMTDLIDKGFEYLKENDYKSACDAWLNVWNGIKFRIKPEFKDMDYLDQQYKGSFYISNFCQDLENELYNAGLDDPVYLEKCIEYCTEFCNYFPNESELIIHNMRRSIADSYIRLKKFDEAKKELDTLISEYPNNPWSYIAYGDMYQDITEEVYKAKEFYERALLFAEDDYDKKAIEERLEDIRIDT